MTGTVGGECKDVKGEPVPEFAIPQVRPMSIALDRERATLDSAELRPHRS